MLSAAPNRPKASGPYIWPSTQGINFFDVSPLYGLTLAEDRLGEALDGRRKDVILVTKCGRYDEDVFDFSAKRITASIEESLKRLRRSAAGA